MPVPSITTMTSVEISTSDRLYSSYLSRASSDFFLSETSRPRTTMYCSPSNSTKLEVISTGNLV